MRGQSHDVHARVQHRDERHEQSAVEPILVKLVRRYIRGRDDNDVAFKQPREKATEDHRIRNIGDVEFVEAQELSLGG